MSDNSVKPGWEGIPMGGVSWKLSEEYLTGDWRSFRPILDSERCTRCLICLIYCPDSSISWDGEDMKINYDFCKGCGICSKECPLKAIEMVKE